MHIYVTGNSKLAIGVMVVCVSVLPLKQTSNLSKVYPPSCPMTTGKSSLLPMFLNWISKGKWKMKLMFFSCFDKINTSVYSALYFIWKYQICHVRYH